MRHFMCAPLAPGPLARRVSARPAGAELIAFSGAAQRLAPAYPGAGSGAVHVAAVTAAADPHLLAAAPAVVQPMRRFGHRHARSTWDWTTPCIAGIKAMQTTRALFQRAPACRRPGVLSRNLPGPSLFAGVRKSGYSADRTVVPMRGPADQSVGDSRLDVRKQLHRCGGVNLNSKGSNRGAVTGYPPRRAFACVTGAARASRWISLRRSVR